MIKQIIPAITPSNITDIQILKDGMNIFLDYLTEHSDIAIDIKNILDEKKVPIYEEFVKIYLDNIYKVLSNTEHNEALYSKLKVMYEAFGLDIADLDLSVNITDLLSKDFILTNKDYKSSKGTPKAMEYIYNIIIKSGIQEDLLHDNTGNFIYSESGNIFEYKIEGTMIDEMYEHFVKPLTHPVGWAYFYQRVFYMSFVDYFNIDFLYNINAMEVRCMNGDLYEKDDYKTNISHTGTQLVQDNTVEFINIEYIGALKSKKTTVYFKSGEYLVNSLNPREFALYSNSGIIIINYLSYNGNCGLYLDYTVDIISTTKDEIMFQDASHLASTTGKMNVFGAGNVYFGSYVIGDELVNKDISVTYKSYVGPKDIVEETRIIDNNFRDLNPDLFNKNWDSLFLKYEEFRYDSIDSEEFLQNHSTMVTKTLKDQHDGTNDVRIFAAGGIKNLDTSNYGTYWDEVHLNFDQFDFDEYSFGGNIVTPNLSGKTARDEYDMRQILQKCSLVDVNIPYDKITNPHQCTPIFEDKFKNEKNWDNYKLKFGSFNYDSEYVSEEFVIHYDKNVWDTDLYFDYFQFDGDYIGGGFT